MRNPRAKKPAGKSKASAGGKSRKVCRCPGVSQRINVVTGAGGQAPPPVMHQVGIPMPTPTIMPQFVFPTSNGFGDPRLATDRDKVARDDHQYSSSPGRHEPNPRMPVAETEDVTRADITPLERFRASRPGEASIRFIDMNKSQLVNEVVRRNLERRSRARQMSVLALQGRLLASQESRE